MAIGRVTNEGRRREQAMAWNAEAHGLGSPAQFHVGLITSAYNFAALADGPDPKHVTCALLRASVSGSDPILATSRYSGNQVPFDGTSFIVSVDTNNNLSVITFASGFDPLVLVTDAAGLANVAGFIITDSNTMASGTKIFAIFPGQATLASVPQNNRVRLRNLTMASQAI